MNWRKLLILSLFFTSVVTGGMKIWMNWQSPTNYIAAFVFQIYCICAGIYPYLHNKKMIGFSGSADLPANSNEQNTDNLAARDIAFYGYVAFYVFMLFV